MQKGKGDFMFMPLLNLQKLWIGRAQHQWHGKACSRIASRAGKHGPKWRKAADCGNFYSFAMIDAFGGGGS